MKPASGELRQNRYLIPLIPEASQGSQKLLYHVRADSEKCDGGERIIRFLSTCFQRVLLSASIAHLSTVTSVGTVGQGASSSAVSAVEGYLRKKPSKGIKEESIDISIDDTITFIHMLQDGVSREYSFEQQLKNEFRDMPSDPKSLAEALARQSLPKLEEILERHLNGAATGEYEWIEGL